MTGFVSMETQGATKQSSMFEWLQKGIVLASGSGMKINRFCSSLKAVPNYPQHEFEHRFNNNEHIKQ